MTGNNLGRFQSVQLANLSCASVSKPIGCPAVLLPPRFQLGGVAFDVRRCWKRSITCRLESTGVAMPSHRGAVGLLETLFGFISQKIRQQDFLGLGANQDNPLTTTMLRLVTAGPIFPHAFTSVDLGWLDRANFTGSATGEQLQP